MSKHEASTAVAVREDIGALWQEGWEPTDVGIKFDFTKDDEGKVRLVDPGKQKVAVLTKGLKAGNVIWGWYVGDTGCLVKDLYGDEALDKFFDDIGYTEDQKAYGRKLMSTSRSYGFPDKVEDLRVKGLTHAHHQVVQGLKEPQRQKELRRALQLGLSKSDLLDRYRELEGKAKGEEEGGELPVFHLKFAAFDPKKDNPEQYLANCHKQLDEEFKYYRDPEAARQREIEDAKKKAVDGLPEDVQAKLLEAGAGMDATKFKALVKETKERATEAAKVEKYLEKHVKDEAKRAEMIAGAKESGMSLEAAKQAVKQYKVDLAEKAKAEKTIESLAVKVRDEGTRKALLERAAAENMSLQQFEGAVREAITKEMYEEEKARLEKQSQEKLAALDPGKFEEKAAAKLAPKQKKAAAPKGGTEGLPMAKGKSGTASKKGKGKKSQ